MDEDQPEATDHEQTQTAAVEIKAEPVKTEPAKTEAVKSDAPKPQGQRPPREDRGPRPGGEQRPGGGGGGDRNRGGGDRGGPRGDRREGGRPGGEHRGGDRGEHRGGRPFDGPMDIELEKLISDSLYLDNQAHAVVVRMRDMDSGTKSQLRRLYNAVRRAVRAPESERQHHFVMLRARLAYTIARHSLRSLDALERLLLQVTRRNDARGYERFKDLFEAIVAYNE
jgi:CRISPR type III-A-associated protein Csm2